MFLGKRKKLKGFNQVVLETWGNRVSNKKVDILTKQLCIENISVSQVSNMNKESSDQLREFINRSKTKEYPVIWVDVLYEKLRNNGKFINATVLIVKVADLDSVVQILAKEPMYSESESTYTVLVSVKQFILYNKFIYLYSADGK